MASLQIDLFDKTNKHRIWVMLRDNLPIEDLIHKLIRDLELPQGEYILIDEEENVTLPEESTLAKEGVRDQHPLRIESKKKIVSFSIPIPIKKGGETYQAGDVRARKARPEEEPPAEKAPARDTACRPKAPTPDEETTALEEKPAPGKKARPAPARTPPPTRPLVPSWRRPIRRPPFLRRVSNQFWALVTPLNIILILIVLFLFCFP
jgi:hypothetical protein